MLGILLSSYNFTPAQQPAISTIDYQAQLMENGEPVNGVVDVQFQLWDDSTTGNSLSTPVVIEDVSVTDGLLSATPNFSSQAPVSFGDTRTWMEVGIRPGAEIGAFTILSPRREIHAAPWATFAESARSLTGGVDDADADPTNEYITGLSLTGFPVQTNLNIEDNGNVWTVDLSGVAEASGFKHYALDAPGRIPEDIVLVDSSGRVGIGTDAPQAQLHIRNPDLTVRPVQIGTKPDLEPGVFFSNATDVVVDNDIAYVGHGQVAIFDVSDPTSIQTITNFDQVPGASQLSVENDLLITVANESDTIFLVDVNDPANPSIISSITDGQNGFLNMAGPQGFDRVGDTLYVACAGSNSLAIFDISDTGNPTQLGVAIENGSIFQNLDFAVDVSVVNNVAYVISGNDDALTMIDVTNPAAPTEIASYVSGDFGFPDSSFFPSAIDVIGTNAYIATANALLIYDVTDPSDPDRKGSITDGEDFGDLSDVRRMYIEGNLAFLPGLTNRTVTIIDISDPDDPQRVSILRKDRPGSENLLVPFGAYAELGRLYVVSTQSGELTIFDLNSTGDSLLVEGDSVFSGGTGSVELLLEADVENTTNNESAQPGIRFSQDGGAIQGRIGFFEAENNLQLQTSGATDAHIVFNPKDNLGIKNDAPQHPLHVGTDTSNGNGAHVTASGIWTNGSSREWKTNFEPLDSRDILSRLMKMPVTRWQFDEDSDEHHIGPTAEDFYEAFGLGHSKQYIATTDADGVALAAIQGLHQKLEEKETEIEEMQEKLKRLEALVEALTQEVEE